MIAGSWAVCYTILMKANDKKTMTLNLTAQEMAVLEELTSAKGLSKTGVMRLALRMLQTVDSKVRMGCKVMVDDEHTHEKRELDFL